MNTQEMFTACFGFLLSAAVLVSPAACTANRHNQITKAIEAGADPIEAKCALEGDAGHASVCIVVAAKRGTK